MSADPPAAAAAEPPRRSSADLIRAILDVLLSCDNVVAYVNGHNHAGGFGVLAGRPFLTLTGMVDTTENAYAVLEAHADHVEVRGYGREPSHWLPFAGPPA